MGLSEDISKGLLEISNPVNKEKLQLDKNITYTIPVPLPKDLIRLKEGKINVILSIADTNDYFTLMTPLGLLTNSNEKLYQYIL
ncbi:MAG: hypothetical protein OEY49_13320 [Candidatus Heimdallarchaeota archaeon]|nr:hypothetical protein [Candidatus Heimdallarchaeota archaeon]